MISNQLSGLKININFHLAVLIKINTNTVNTNIVVIIRIIQMCEIIKISNQTTGNLWNFDNSYFFRSKNLVNQQISNLLKCNECLTNCHNRKLLKLFVQK